MKRVVILGGGFGGIYTAMHLLKDSRCHVTLINPENYFLFTPLLHEVAVGTLNRHNIVHPTRELFSSERFSFIRARATKIDATKKRVYYGEGGVDYDYLVVAVGAKTAYYDVEGASEHALPLKTIPDAIAVRDSLICSLESAAIASSAKERRLHMTYIVVGAGATGVQVVSDIHNFLDDVLGQYPIREKPHILLLQAQDKILPFFEEDLRMQARERLKALGIDVRTASPVTKITKDAVLMDSKKIEASTIVWAGGITPQEIKTVPRLQDDRNFFPVTEEMLVQGQEDIFALGDCSYVVDHPYGSLAQVAVQQAETVSANIIQSIEGGQLEPFRFVDRGTLISVGDRYAVGLLKLFGREIPVSSWWVWFIKRHVYWTNIVGWQNKIKVGIDWFLNLIFPRDTSEI